MIASEGRLYFVHGAAVWPERPSLVESPEARAVDDTQVAADPQQRFPGLFHSALPFDHEPQETLENDEPWRDPSGYNLLWMAASLFEFHIPTDRIEAGYPYLLYEAGEVSAVR
jgi:hypothetical protein